MDKDKLVSFLIKNFTNEDGDLDLGGLDFSKFDGNVNLSCMRVKKDLDISGTCVQGNLEQGFQMVLGDLHQGFQAVAGELSDRFNEASIVKMEESNYGK